MRKVPINGDDLRDILQSSHDGMRGIRVNKHTIDIRIGFLNKRAAYTEHHIISTGQSLTEFAETIIRSRTLMIVKNNARRSDLNITVNGSTTAKKKMAATYTRHSNKDLLGEISFVLCRKRRATSKLFYSTQLQWVGSSGDTYSRTFSGPALCCNKTLAMARLSITNRDYNWHCVNNRQMSIIKNYVRGL